MSEPESREAGEKKREDESPESLTLSSPEPVEPAEPGESSAEDRRSASLAEDVGRDDPVSGDFRPDADRALPDEAEIIAEMPPAFDRDIGTEGGRDEATLTGPAVAAPSPRKPEPAKGVGAGGLVLLLLGGIAGAAGGFAYSRHAKPDWPLADYGLTEQAAAQQSELAALRSQIAAQPAPAPVAEGPSAAELSAAEGRAAAAEAKVAELEAQLAAVASQTAAAPAEAAPADVAAPEAGALEQEIAALRAQIAAASGSAVSDAQAEAQARIAEAERQAAQLKAEVEAAARAVTTAADVAQIRSAIEAGTAYAAPLEDLASKGVDIPMKLIEGAETGFPTLDTLEDSYPEAAREALAIARRATMGDDWLSRAEAFLLSEAGLRSLAPRDGSDPDAVLSRAEAAVRAGDLQKALDEIATLPAEGQEAMAGWTAEARKRIEAIDAVAALAAAAEGK